MTRLRAAEPNQKTGAEAIARAWAGPATRLARGRAGVVCLKFGFHLGSAEAVGCRARVVGDREYVNSVSQQPQSPHAGHRGNPGPLSALQGPKEPAARVAHGEDRHVQRKVHAVVEATVGRITTVGFAGPTGRHKTPCPKLVRMESIEK